MQIQVDLSDVKKCLHLVFVSLRAYTHRYTLDLLAVPTTFLAGPATCSSAGITGIFGDNDNGSVW